MENMRNMVSVRDYVELLRKNRAEGNLARSPSDRWLAEFEDQHKRLTQHIVRWDELFLIEFWEGQRKV